MYQKLVAWDTIPAMAEYTSQDYCLFHKLQSKVVYQVPQTYEYIHTVQILFFGIALEKIGEVESKPSTSGKSIQVLETIPLQ
mmetsp:Transcript_25141/g.58113  ORF Transcript_25141/g.58113 Transcript_25141/m.58113 type:complete len:82 (+) Transcript_25141:403-648(+)